MLKLSITALILAGGMGVFGSAPLLAEEAKPADAKPAEAKPAEEKKSGDQPADAKKTAGPDYEVGLDGL